MLSSLTLANSVNLQQFKTSIFILLVCRSPRQTINHIKTWIEVGDRDILRFSQILSSFDLKRSSKFGNFYWHLSGNNQFIWFSIKIYIASPLRFKLYLP